MCTGDDPTGTPGSWHGVGDGIVGDDGEAFRRGVDVVHRGTGQCVPTRERNLVAWFAAGDAQSQRSRSATPHTNDRALTTNTSTTASPRPRAHQPPFRGTDQSSVDRTTSLKERLVDHG